METKICTKCGCNKKLEQFRKSGKYYRGECKECENEKNKEYQKKNKIKILAQQKNYKKKNEEKIKKQKHKLYLKNKEKIHQYNIFYNKKHKEYFKNKAIEYRETHRQELIEYNKKFRENNKDKIKEYQQKDYQRRKKDPILRLQRNIRNLLNDSFKKHKYRKSKHTEEILGCKVDEFILHLLETFKSNYGYDWNKIEAVHIDHIIPLAVAKTEEDVIRLCHYTNLQLLKAKDNLEKNDKLDWKLH